MAGDSQKTNIKDSSQTASQEAVVIGGKGNAVTINSLDANTVDAALASGVASVDRVLDFAGDSSNLAFTSIENTRNQAFELINRQAAENQAAAIRAQDLASNLALKSFNLADEKTTTPDERVLNLGKLGLYVLGGLAALFLALLFFRKPKSAKA